MPPRKAAAPPAIVRPALREADVDWAMDLCAELCAIPSPTGMVHRAHAWLLDQFRRLGFAATVSRKGTVCVDLGGSGEPLLIAAHIDTLGAVVRAVKPNGRLRLARVGGYSMTQIENENCTIHTRDGRTYSGTVQFHRASHHVFPGAEKVERNDEVIDLVLDEKVFTVDDVAALGIRTGDFVSFDPRVVRLPNGFIKSRHLDDKLCVGMLLAIARAVKQGRLKLARKVYLVFTTYEEVGHGGASGYPADIAEFLVLDMGCVGDDLGGSEYKVSICAKDSAGPFDWDMTTRLVQAAEALGLPFAVDTFPTYSSDVAVALKAGLDARHGLIGPGVFASHGYERAHRDGVTAAMMLAAAYMAMAPVM